MLIGIGMGPGDPKMVTRGAVEELERCDRVFVPGRRARELAEPHCGPEELDFPMTRDEGELREAWRRNAEIVGEAAEDERVGFPVIGDPNVLSTFNHIRRNVEEMYPGVEVDTVPGVSALTGFLSETDGWIEGSFLVTDGSPVRDVVAAKATAPEERAGELREEGFGDFSMVSRLGFEDCVSTRELPEESHYFTVLHGKRVDGGGGE